MLDALKILSDNGWTIRQGSRPTVYVAEKKGGRKLYGSPEEMIRQLRLGSKLN